MSMAEFEVEFCALFVVSDIVAMALFEIVVVALPERPLMKFSEVE